MRLKKSTRVALAVASATIGLAVTPIGSAAAATGGGCGNWTHFSSDYAGTVDTNGKACISYSAGKVRPDSYVNFHFARPRTVSACRVDVKVYKKVGGDSVKQNERRHDCLDDARENDTGLRYAGTNITTSSGEYWTVLDVWVKYNGSGWLRIHAGSPHVKP